MVDITVTNTFTHDISWLGTDQCGFDADQSVIDTWKINVRAHMSYIDHFLSVLTPDEINRANKYLRKEDHDSFIISRGSLRFILSKYLNISPSAIRFQPEKNHKPFIDYPETDIQFNLSDTHGMVMISVGREPLGVDVEYIKPEFHYDDILPLNFNQPEIDFIRENDRLKRFFILWTRKEALLKATGIGLTDYLPKIQSLDGEFQFNGSIISTQNNWQLSSFMPHSGYVATIANSSFIKKINYYDFDFGRLIV
jgi:4'-phosphopantetheinyl transferase